ncbi:MAG: hypothetical protein CMN29_23150 [Sandaracinus sp.]|nr:hypothetical protein [Sandaracinus sp.]
MDDYVAELRAAGPASFRAAHDHAVLVRRDSTDDDDAPEFHTGFMNREEMAARLAELDKAGGPSRVGSVHEVTKRKGGIFADRIGIGRARNADVCLFLAKMSKYHAYVTREDDRWFVTDAGSKNGTTVDGERAEPKTPTELRNACEVGFGPYRFFFYTPEGFLELVERRRVVADSEV